MFWPTIRAIPWLSCSFSQVTFEKRCQNPYQNRYRCFWIMLFWVSSEISLEWRDPSRKSRKSHELQVVGPSVALRSCRTCYLWCATTPGVTAIRTRMNNALGRPTLGQGDWAIWGKLYLISWDILPHFWSKHIRWFLSGKKDGKASSSGPSGWRKLWLLFSQFPSIHP